MIRRYLTVALVGLATPASATLSDCKDLYVVRLHMNMSDGLPQVVLAENPSALSGSYWVYPNSGFPERSYQALYSALLTAKISRKKIRVFTNASDSCSIGTGTHNLTMFEVQPDP
jgi:hypothetical protein